MEKTKQVKHEASTPEQADAPADKAVGHKGPKGVDLHALIFVRTEGGVNPKRPGSKAYDAFAAYRDGMTVSEYLDVAGKAATPNLVYDSARGFIQIEGYTPAKPFVPKERVAKAPKAKKAKKAKAEKTAEAPSEAQAEIEAAVVVETID